MGGASSVAVGVKQEQFVELLTEKIRESRASIVEQWSNPKGTNTRHFIVDDLLPKATAEEVYESFPRNGEGFFDRESFREKKRTSADLSQYNPILADLTYAFQSKQVVELISDLVGMEHLEPDPKLYAGGLSMMFPNDYLNPHIDNSHDAERSRYRRLNLLYYVSPDWCLENGGNFELWDAECKVPKTLVSHQNRLVVMETNKYSWHSVSPVKASRPRCCVSNYYFSKISPDGSDYFHVTSFVGRPNQPVRRVLGHVDNCIRNTVSKALKVGRGKQLVNKDK